MLNNKLLLGVVLLLAMATLATGAALADDEVVIVAVDQDMVLEQHPDADTDDIVNAANDLGADYVLDAKIYAEDVPDELEDITDEDITGKVYDEDVYESSYDAILDLLITLEDYTFDVLDELDS